MIIEKGSVDDVRQNGFVERSKKLTATMRLMRYDISHKCAYTEV